MIPLNVVAQNGLGAVSDDQLNTYTQWTTNMASLRQFIGKTGMAMIVEGANAPNDGGQGAFWWNPNSTTPDDNGVTTVKPPGIPPTYPGAWNRLPLAVAAINPNTITLGLIQQIPPNTILGNNTGSTGNVTALTVAQVQAMLGAIGAVIPPGMIMPYSAQAAPSGWLNCDGSAYSRTTYAALNAIASAAGYGVPWGAGDGSTTFNVPDLRGRFIRGWDSGGAVDPGRAFGSIQAPALQAHQHITDTPNVFITGSHTSPFGNTTVATPTIPGFSTAGSGTEHYGLSNDGAVYSSYNPNPGGQIAPETRPTNVALAYCIKT